MNWINYLLYALALWFVVQRFLPQKGLKNLSAQEVSQHLTQPSNYQFIDVREKHEYKQGHIKGFKNIPLSQLKNRLSEINQNKQIVLTCRSGMRSRQAARMLKGAGYKGLSHLKTGVAAWNGELLKEAK